ncbi:MAG: shikimate kinase [Candidatus Melainabacteria bacterium]|nr:shikimate kinase [Candidatus Melainabacteria bacterium]
MNRPPEVKPIVLIGLPGAGKTSVGEILARLLNLSFFDSDRLVEAKENRTVSRIFAEDGENRFRELESRILDDFKTGAFVLSCGGGLPMTPGNMDILLKLGQVVYLKTEIEELVKRLAATHDRPLLKSNPEDSDNSDEHVLRKRLSTLESERAQVYERAGLTVQTDGFSTAEVAERILQRMIKSDETRKR